MIDDADPPKPSLSDEIDAILACLAHARQALGTDDIANLNDVWPRIARCAEKIQAMPADERQRMQLMLLTLHDDLDRTIRAFRGEQQQVRDQLMSANQSRTADAAYRQMQKP
ncbi:MAG: hypothetical protein ACR2Q4_19270 [Geminicoccaceae bacterium]